MTSNREAPTSLEDMSTEELTHEANKVAQATRRCLGGFLLFLAVSVGGAIHASASGETADIFYRDAEEQAEDRRDWENEQGYERFVGAAERLGKEVAGNLYPEVFLGLSSSLTFAFGMGALVGPVMAKELREAADRAQERESGVTEGQTSA